ncbi:MAG: 6-bladed beta-propeller [Candidatus Aminicenantes bacterium]|nr:6-bladed beta-propeller [Candidatus Aminicenantes bacterium]
MESKHFYRGLILFGLFLIFFLCVSLEAAPEKVKVIVDNSSIRATPELGGKVLAKVAQNTILESESKQGEWYKVIFEREGVQISGFIHEMTIEETTEDYPTIETGTQPALSQAQAQLTAEIEVKMTEGRKFITQDRDFEKAIETLSPLIAKIFRVTDNRKQRELGAEIFLWKGLAYISKGEQLSALIEFRNMFEVDDVYSNKITKNILQTEIVTMIKQAENEYKGLVTEYSLEISTTPKEATIIINGKEIGTSPEIYRTTTPKIVIELQKKGFKPIKDEFFITQPSVKKEYVLESAGKNLEIKSNPIGASVYLDGVDTGKVTNCVIPAVLFGIHKIKLVKGNYAEWEGTIEINAGQETFSLDGALTPNKYTFLTKFGGTAVKSFKQISGVTVDKNNNLYIIDTSSAKVKKYNPEGKNLRAFGQIGKEFRKLKIPAGIAIDSKGNLYVTDAKTHGVLLFDATGKFRRKWGAKMGSGNANFNTPIGIAVDSSDNIYVVDSRNNRIKKYSNTGRMLKAWGKQGTSNGDFLSPRGVAVNKNNEVFVIDRVRIQKFSSEGEFISAFGKQGAGDGEFNRPSGMYIDQNGYIYVADSGNNRIQKFDQKGQFIMKWGTPGSGNGQMAFPIGITVDSRGYVYVAERDNNRIQLFGFAPSTRSLKK